MERLSFKKRSLKRKWLRRIVVIFAVGLIALVGLVYTFEKVYADKIYPGVSVGAYDLGGLTCGEARGAIQELADQLVRGGLVFTYQSHRVNISPIVASATDPDFSYRVLDFKVDEMVNDVCSTGRNSFKFLNWWTQCQALVAKKAVGAKYDLDEQELLNILKNNFEYLEDPAKDAELKVDGALVRVVPEKIGRVFDYQSAINGIKQVLNQMAVQPIEMALIIDYPKVTQKGSELALALAKETVDLSPVTLKYGEKWWRVHSGQYGEWLELKDTGDNELTQPLSLGFNQEKVLEYVKELAKDVNVEPQDAKFKMENGRVTEFQISRKGRQLDAEKSYQLIEKGMIKEKRSEIELAVNEILPGVVEEDLNNIGIRELIGLGESDFKGSPVNRIHNIKNGAKTLHGMLIKPDEDFSLIKALGEIDEKSGYKPELVIKGNKTIPEYGGGLCQIGTTTFRVALRSGLPILERQPHSYRVSYYEPAGMDATIYNPKPDLRFKNDTGHYILFQTRIEGTKLIFEFYGTKDGRQVEISPDPPKISNLRSPGPTKIIETEDLAPGQKRCTESAHVGADTEFAYKVTYPSGEAKEQVFKSHYVPWQAVCLVGREPSKENEKTEDNSVMNN